MRILFSIFSLFLLTACNRGQNQTPGKASADSTGSVEITQGDANQITCWGIGDIELSDDLATIEEKIGKEHLKQDSLFMEGMFETMVTTVWSSTPKEITIRWKEKEPPYQTIDYLEIASAEAPYHFANGVRIGMSLKELEQLNGGKPINLHG